MYNNGCDFLRDIYSYHLEKINGVKFTRREIDIIAFLISGRSAKKTGSFLSLSPKTVSNYIQNIMVKLGCNSREGIIDFIEKSGRFSFIKKHYLTLLNKAEFEKCLKRISMLKEGETPICAIIYRREQEDKRFLFGQLKTHLEQAGIKAFVEARENQESISDLIHEFQIKNYTICALSNIYDTVNISKITETPKNVLFLLFDKEPHRTSIFSHEIKHTNVIKYKNYYFSAFEILKKIFPKCNFDNLIEEFKEKYESTYEVSKIEHSLKENTFIKLLKKRKWHILILFFIVEFSLVFQLLTSNRKGTELKIAQHTEKKAEVIVRSDLFLPAKRIFLERPELIAQIDEKFKGRDGIQIIALVGMGGAGKTTIARQYAHKQKTDVIWEIDAETKEKFRRSFESLAYALSKTEDDQKVLKTLQDIKNPEEKEEKIVYFVKQRLRPLSSWFLIYDDVEKFSDIQKYFPQDFKTWGQGKVILTTRDANIKNNKHINKVIQIKELSPDQKFTLFSMIINEDNAPSFSLIQAKKAKEFLEKLPSFPLDTSVAAYYLIATKVSYETYLENLERNNKDFSDIQQNLLKEGENYTKNRYGIITLSLQKLVNAHKDFGDLLLFIALMDSQNVPRDLLIQYKYPAIVDNFIYHLRKYSLITDESLCPSLGLSISIHRSTQAITLNYLTKLLNLSENKSLIDPIANVLGAYIEEIINKEDPGKANVLITHGNKFLSHHNLLTDAVETSINSKLGGIYWYLSYYTKSREILEESIYKLKKNHTKKYHELSRALRHLGIINFELSNYKKCKDLFEESLSVYQKHSKNHIEVARTLGYYGILYKALGNHKKAKNILEQTLMIYQQQSGNPLEIARTLGYLGIIYKELGHYKEAETIFEQALMIYREQSSNHIRVSWCLAHLGNIYRELGDYRKAKDFLEKSLANYKEQISPTNDRIGWVLASLGSVYRDLGYYKKAKSLFEESLHIYRIHSYNSANFAWVLGFLGNIYGKLGNYEKSKSLLEQALMIYRKNSYKNPPDVTWVLTHLGIAYGEVGNYEKAKLILNESLEICKEHYGTDHIETARVLMNLGQIYLLKGECDTAEPFLTKASGLFEKNKSPDRYMILEALAELHLKKFLKEKKKDLQEAQGLKNQAINYLTRSLEDVKIHFPEDSLHISRLQLKLTNIK